MTTVVDYASLTQAVGDWLTRTDLGTKIDYFIQMAENTIYNDVLTQNQGRGVKAMETTFSGTTAANGTLALPTGYLGIKYALLSAYGETFELQRANAEFIYTQYPNRNPDNAPAYIARDGQAFTFGPFPDSTYTVSGVYWQRSAALSSTNTTTWMTSSIPAILLAACNAAAAMMARDADAIELWGGAYKAQLDSFLLADRAEDVSGSALTMFTA